MPEALRIESIVGSAADPDIADRLHHLEHHGAVEYVALSPADMQRRRLRARTDRGSECAIVLPRSAALFNGAVLHLAPERAVVARLDEPPALALRPLDAAAALELGYLAGNMHWKVRFDGPVLKIALDGPEADYLARLRPLLERGCVERAS